MNILQTIETERHFTLPEIYKQFYRNCASSMPESLAGTDLINFHPDLQEWALELLEENGISNFLASNDYVFMMHQDFVFWYFKVDGNQDPEVYVCKQKKLVPEKAGAFSVFINALV
jgi:hypothetical protein